MSDTRGWTDREGWHDDDCGGFPACNGCGWIDAGMAWWPGPCPPEDELHQSARAEYGVAFAHEVPR